MESVKMAEISELTTRNNFLCRMNSFKLENNPLGRQNLLHKGN